MLHAMMPEQHDLAFCYLLGPGKDQLDYIIEKSEESMVS